jgi:O-antigen ligase
LIVARLLWQHAPDRRGDARIVFRRIAVLELGLLCAATAAIAFFVFRDLLPSGSPELRLLTYEQRLLAFRESPLIGTLFQGSPLMELPGRWSTLVTPSHSDLLDILAFGGVAGFALFVAPLLVAGRAGWAALRAAPEQRWLGAYSLAVAIVFLVEMAFNPVWDQPKLAFFFWMAVGCLLAFRRPSGPQGSPVPRPALRSASNGLG